MKTQPNTSAFPEVQSETNRDMLVSEIYSQGGLTKREYFAAKAMQGMAAIPDKGIFKSYEEMYETLAEHSVKIADAIIEQLNKEI